MTSPRSANDPVAFDRSQLEALRPGLELLALRAFGDRQVAEEVAQESLARALVAADRGTPIQEGKVAAFVAGIARHVIADRRRESARLAPLSAADAVAAPGADPLDHLLSADDRRAVHRALAALSAPDRELLHLCYFEGRTPTEIAAALGEPPERIRKRKSRALERLREALADGEGHARLLGATIQVPPPITAVEGAP